MATAVPLFNGLKHLPCPKEAEGAECTTTGCLFGHRADQQASKVHPASLDGALDDAHDSDATRNINDARPQKRQKTESKSDRQSFTRAGDSQYSMKKIEATEVYDPLSPPVAANSPYLKNESSTQSPKSSESPHQLSTLAPSSARTPVSTSRENLWKGSSTPKTKPSSGLVQSTPNQLSSPSSAKSSPIPPATASTSLLVKDKTGSSSTDAKPQRKAETLNPRLLKSSPAAHNIRYKLLSLLHADFVRLNTEASNKSINDPSLKAIVLSDQQLIWMALDREQHLATHRAAIYSNVMKLEVMKYKRMSFNDWAEELKQTLEKKIPQKKSDLGDPIVINTGLTPDQEVEILRRLVTPITSLQQYGYVPTLPTEEEIANAKEGVDMAAGWEKCERCTVRFKVFPGRNIETGALASGGQCTHHPGRTFFPERPRGDMTHVPKKYRCCNQDVGESLGCAVAQHHVWKSSEPKRLASLWNFVETPASDDSQGSKAKAVAFDCEMGYTVHGLELIRLTATSWPDGAELVDVLVQPLGEILDLNSRYSGVWPEDLARAVPWTKDWTPPQTQPGERRILQKVSSPQSARDLLFSHISPDTILLGHGLENDLNAMRMVHPKIVDTILLYPHRRGLPIRNGLKTLVDIHLNRRIQVDTGEGHDSAEDARAAGDLARLRVQKEWSSMQSDGWKLLDGIIRPPGWKPQATARDSEESVSTDAEKGGARLTEQVLGSGS